MEIKHPEVTGSKLEYTGHLQEWDCLSHGQGVLLTLPLP